MISGSNYVKVEANSVMPMAEGASGNQGFVMPGFYVNWTNEGITAKNWTDATMIATGPFYNMTAEWVEGNVPNENDILYIIYRDKNLNILFNLWGNNTEATDRLDFVNRVAELYDMTPDGCIGDQL